MYQQLPAEDQAPAPLTDRKAIVTACVSSHWDEVEGALVGLGFGPWTVTNLDRVDSGGWGTAEVVRAVRKQSCPWGHEQPAALLEAVCMAGTVDGHTRQYLYFAVSPCCGRWGAIGPALRMLADRGAPKAKA